MSCPGSMVQFQPKAETLLTDLASGHPAFYLTPGPCSLKVRTQLAADRGQEALDPYPSFGMRPVAAGKHVVGQPAQILKDRGAFDLIKMHKGRGW